MKKMWIVAALLLAVTGCATVEQPAEPESTPQAEEIAPAPLEAAPKDDTATDDSPEGQYLSLIRQYEDRGPEIADATDEQLIAAGLEACRQLADGVPELEVSVVDGEEPNPATGMYVLSSPIMAGARDLLC